MKQRKGRKNVESRRKSLSVKTENVSIFVSLNLYLFSFTKSIPFICSRSVELSILRERHYDIGINKEVMQQQTRSLQRAQHSFCNMQVFQKNYFYHYYNQDICFHILLTNFKIQFKEPKAVIMILIVCSYYFVKSFLLYKNVFFQQKRFKITFCSCLGQMDRFRVVLWSKEIIRIAK